jgi:CheY-like chemotaxis protein
MMTATSTLGTNRAPQPTRTVAVVSSPAHLELIERVLDGWGDDIVFVESVARAYSQIKRVMPDVVVLCLSSDDADGCQVLSMLALDAATSHIPVVTCLAGWSDRDEHNVDELDAVRRPTLLSLN